MAEFPLLLRRLRRERHFTQRALAMKLDVSAAYIALLESGARTPSRRFLDLAAAFFECSTDDFLEVKEPTSRKRSGGPTTIDLVTGGGQLLASRGKNLHPGLLLQNTALILTFGEVRVVVDRALLDGLPGLLVRARRGGTAVPEVHVRIDAPSGRYIGGPVTAAGNFQVSLTPDFISEGMVRVTAKFGGESRGGQLKLTPETKSAPTRPPKKARPKATSTTPVLSVEDQTLRKAVERYDGVLAQVAAHLGLTRVNASHRLNGPVHREWWRAFKAARSKRRARMRKRGTRVRAWVRDMMRVPTDVPFIQTSIERNVCRVGRRRGLSDDEARAAAREALAGKAVDLEALVRGDWFALHHGDIAESVLVLAEAMGLKRGPRELLRPVDFEEEGGVGLEGAYKAVT